MSTLILRQNNVDFVNLSILKSDDYSKHVKVSILLMSTLIFRQNNVDIVNLSGIDNFYMFGIGKRYEDR